MSPITPAPGDGYSTRAALVFGEALWDLLPSGPVLGGAPLNFAYRLGSLGVPTKLVSQVGNDDLGKETLDRMRALNMDTSLVTVSETLPTATVIVKLDAARQPSYTIVEDVAYDEIPWTEELADASSQSSILGFGTLAQRDPRSRETLRSLVANFGGDTIIVDINLRPGCWNEETVRWSLKHATIAKLNDEELTVIAAIYGIAGGSIRDQADALRTAAELDLLVVTMGAAGALGVSEDGISVVPGFEVDVDDPCGSGDAFAGMLIASLESGFALDLALLRANALGALVATQPGATGTIGSAELDSMLLE